MDFKDFSFINDAQIKDLLFILSKPIPEKSLEVIPLFLGMEVVFIELITQMNRFFSV